MNMMIKARIKKYGGEKRLKDINRQEDVGIHAGLNLSDTVYKLLGDVGSPFQKIGQSYQRR